MFAVLHLSTAGRLWKKSGLHKQSQPSPNAVERIISTLSNTYQSFNGDIIKSVVFFTGMSTSDPFTYALGHSQELFRKIFRCELALLEAVIVLSLLMSTEENGFHHCCNNDDVIASRTGKLRY